MRDDAIAFLSTAGSDHGARHLVKTPSKFENAPAPLARVHLSKSQAAFFGTACDWLVLQRRLAVTPV